MAIKLFLALWSGVFLKISTVYILNLLSDVLALQTCYSFSRKAKNIFLKFIGLSQELPDQY